MRHYYHSYIAERLYDVNSVDEKFAILEDVIKKAGFDGVIYTFAPKLSRLIELQPVYQFSQAYAPLIKNYQENDFFKDDFLFRLLDEGITRPIDWWKETKSIKLTDAEKHINTIARNQFGITKGLAFPTLTNDLGVAGVSLISMKEEYENKDIDPETIESLHKCAKIYHDHMMGQQDDRYNFVLPLLNSLSEKQKIVIKHLISGQPMKKIEDYGVTERYGEKLLFELRKNFGSISKNELIYLLGLLNISEYLEKALESA